MSSYVLSLGSSFIKSHVTDGLYGVSRYVYAWLRPNVVIKKEVELDKLYSKDSGKDKREEDWFILSSLPSVSIQFPSFSEIGFRVLTSMAVDVPIYTMKCLYKAPVPTAIALYMVLPTEITVVLIQYMGYAIFKVYKIK
jgi:hypothetical protein